MKLENRELLEKVTCLEREKRERSLLGQEAMSLEHEKLVQKVLKLETELQQGRKSLLERDQLFQVNEQHQSEKTNSLHHDHKQTQVSSCLFFSSPCVWHIEDEIIHLTH